MHPDSLTSTPSRRFSGLYTLLVFALISSSDGQRTARPKTSTTETILTTSSIGVAADRATVSQLNPSTTLEIRAGEAKTLSCEILGSKLKIQRARYTASGANQKSATCPETDITPTVGLECDGSGSCNLNANDTPSGNADRASCAGRSLIVDYSCASRSKSVGTTVPHKAFINIFYDGFHG
ncbi:hypothetical protein RvY_03711 [Ramazzottius varieornatus]|uniref:SUEL-type lectin domain-containing protein n=1 Tax=Ramazzottius varieornatus TaxID=947166 RepID=A0A1D1USP5_RAMVA|nr:hypothetical protein RvY_03711 [Ramazzottius varieornatus]